MMRSAFHRPTLLAIVALALVLAACTGNADPSQTPVTWIDKPLNGASLPAGLYEVRVHAAYGAGISQIELKLDGGEAQVLAVSSVADDLLVTLTQGFDFQPGTHTLEARGIGSDGAQGEAAVAVFTVLGEAERAQVEVEAASPTPTASSTPTETPTPAPDELFAVPLQNSNCRLGCQASLFDIADTLFEGEQYEINGFSPDGFFAQFIGPATGQRCWVPLSLLELQLNGEAIPFEQVPEAFLSYISCPATPTPTLTPTFTPEPSDTPTPPQCSDGID
ncbi:MAG: hypothetical protein MI685_05770, partial [Chlorobiales bacterium]|nr:hypothetical protein [Chlorobiales bacterium]